MFRRLMDITQSDGNTTILDVGVTNDQRKESNFLEKLYPYPENITAVGLEEAYFLEKDYPGVTYLKADGKDLPFKDGHFSLVTSFAVIEHVGSREEQKKFVHEICRVGRSCIITTPNRWYPMEVHTMLPLVHWLPSPHYRSMLRLMGKAFYSNEEHLNLLDRKTLQAMFPDEMKVTDHHFKLGGIVSNLFFYARW